MRSPQVPEEGLLKSWGGQFPPPPPPAAIASPNFRFEAASFLTKNGGLDIVERLGPDTKNLDRG